MAIINDSSLFQDYINNSGKIPMICHSDWKEKSCHRNQGTIEFLSSFEDRATIASTIYQELILEFSGLLNPSHSYVLNTSPQDHFLFVHFHDLKKECDPFIVTFAHDNFQMALIYKLKSALGT